MASLARALLLASALPLLTLACSGDGNSTQITAHDLEAMLLTKDELGEKFDAFVLDTQRSGPTSNDFIADDATEEQVVLDSQRVTGFRRGYTGNHVMVSVLIDLHRTPEGAQHALDFLVDGILDAAQDPGDPQGEEFPAGRIGDRARAFDLRGAAGERAIYVAFWEDRLFVTIIFLADDESPVIEDFNREDTLNVAQKSRKKSKRA